MEQRTAQLEIQYLNRSHPAMDLFRAVCVHDPGALHSMGADALEEDAILIMPAGYELLDHDQAHQLSDLLQVGVLLVPGASASGGCRMCGCCCCLVVVLASTGGTLC